jgi:hypothetical protein
MCLKQRGRKTSCVILAVSIWQSALPVIGYGWELLKTRYPILRTDRSCYSCFVLSSGVEKRASSINVVRRPGLNLRRVAVWLVVISYDLVDQIRDSSNWGFLIFAVTTTALELTQLRLIRGALYHVVKWSGSDAIYSFTTLDQQNAHYCSLDIYIISQWIFLRFSTHNLRDTGTYFLVVTTVVQRFIFYSCVFIYFKVNVYYFYIFII